VAGHDSRTGQSAPRKRADARRNEETLLDAAAAAFVTSGVDVPVRVVAAKAGVGVGTIYRHRTTPWRSGSTISEQPPYHARRMAGLVIAGLRLR